MKMITEAWDSESEALGTYAVTIFHVYAYICRSVRAVFKSFSNIG